MKTSYSYLLVAGLLAASGSAHAQNWVGTTSPDWTDGTNWSGGAPPANGNWTIIDTTLNTPAISTTVLNTAADSWIGTDGMGTAGVGVLDINSGGSIDSSTKWIFVGGDNTGGGDGTINVNSGGIYTSDNQIRLGPNGGVGNLNVNGGAVTVAAMDDGGGTANINITNGGTVEATAGNIRMPIGGGSMDSGSFGASGQIFVGGGAGASTFELTGGTLSTGSWLPVGIGDDNVGTLNVSGGVVNVCQTDGATTIGANSNAVGAVNMTNGTWTNGNGGIILGEQGNGNGSFTLDGGDLTTTRMRVAPGAAASATLNLNGGTFSTGSVEIGPGTATVNLNGTPITANADSIAFFAGGEANLLTTTTFNTAGFNVSGDTSFIGTAGIIKNGAGTLSLTSPFHELSGPITVNAGGFSLGASAPFDTPFTGDLTIADGAAFGVRTDFPDDLMEPANLTFGGTTSTLNIDFVDPDFIVPSAPIVMGTSGVLSTSGTTTINIIGANFASGTYVLIDYSAGSKSGASTGTWLLGTLPAGITAPGGIVDDGSTVEIELIAPAPLWAGTQNANWDNTTENWEDQGSGDPTAFSSGAVATFEDGALELAITTTENVTPSLAAFKNDTDDYSLTAGGGVIAGGGGLTKSMAANLTITSMPNTFTGTTRIEGGTISVEDIPNGGVAGPIGASPSDAANLVLSGGTLEYGGLAATSDRGFTVEADNSGISVQNELTLSGEIATTGGNIVKSGPGILNLTNIGTNTIGITNPGLSVSDGLLNFSGSGTQIMNVGGNVVVGNDAAFTGNLSISDTTLNVGNNLILGIGATGTASMSGGTLNTVDEIFVGEGAGGNGSLTITAGTINANNWIAVGRNGSTGALNVEGGTVNVAIDDPGNFLAVGSDLGAGSGSGTVNQTGGVVNCPGMWMGENGDSQGIYNLDAGTFNCTQDAVILGKQGNGVGIFSNNGGAATVTGNVLIADLDTASGILNLNGGSFAANNIGSGPSTGSSTLNFDGGTLIANESNATFIAGLTTATVLSGGGTIDTNGFDPAVPQSISGSGNLNKTGTGTLTLSGTNTHSGNLVIVAGTVTTTTTTTLHGSSGVDLKSGATLNLDFTGDQFVEEFFIDGVSQGDGTYDMGNTAGITGTGKLVVQPFVADPYDSWIESYFMAETDPGIIGKDADPDMDGQSNKLEFALGGAPNSGSNNAKVYSVTSDRLLLTIAVLDTTPAFSAGPAPSATIDDCTYTVYGSDELTTFTSAVTGVAVVDVGLPTAPAGYEYRTFQLDNSVGFPDKGFMRVEITP